MKTDKNVLLMKTGKNVALMKTGNIVSNIEYLSLIDFLPKVVFLPLSLVKGARRNKNNDYFVRNVEYIYIVSICIVLTQSLFLQKVAQRVTHGNTFCLKKCSVHYIRNKDYTECYCFRLNKF